MGELTFEAIQEHVAGLAHKVLETAGMELIELKIGGHRNDVMIQIIADKPFGGINIRECAILNKELVAAIEQENFLPPEIFSLELSSPGLDRPLVTRKDFMRFIGQDVHFWFHEPIDGKKEVQGKLVEAGEKDLIVKVLGKQAVLPLSSIIKGMLVI
jgi:ribosome maturation factor RimP